MKAPVGGAVCLKFQEFTMSPVIVRLFFIVSHSSTYSTNVLTYVWVYCYHAGRLGSAAIWRRSKIGKCWHLKMDEEQVFLLLIYVWAPGRGLGWNSSTCRRAFGPVKGGSHLC